MVVAFVCWPPSWVPSAKTKGDLPEIPQAASAPVNEVSPARQAFEETIAALPADASDQETILREALAEWAVYEPLAAKAWMESRVISDAELNSKRQAALAISWAETDPAAAGAFVAEAMAPGVNRNIALVSVTQRWAQQDPASAGKFVLGLADVELQKNAAVELVAIWADRDTQPPAEWIQSLPFSPLRDACTDRLAREISAEAPDAAKAWAGQIQDAGLREKCLTAISALHEAQ
jgi:hypothetical protein